MALDPVGARSDVVIMTTLYSGQKTRLVVSPVWRYWQMRRADVYCRREFAHRAFPVYTPPFDELDGVFSSLRNLPVEANIVPDCLLEVLGVVLYVIADGRVID